MKKIFTAMMALFFMTATSGLVLACGGDGAKCNKDKKEAKVNKKDSAKKKLAKKTKVESKKEQASNS
jgi:hypothetical protein